MKTCNKCNQLKSLECYKNDPRNKDGKQGICTECIRVAEKARRDKRQAEPPKAPEAKTCRDCTQTKPIAEFYKDSGYSDGYRPNCKACKDKHTHKWRDDNREQYNATHREYCHKNYQKLRLQRYKLTPKQHAQMLADQKGVCAICKLPPKGKRPLCVDHRHSDDKVRGLLCYGCNRALHVLETKELLVAALGYLDGYK